MSNERKAQTCPNWTNMCPAWTARMRSRRKQRLRFVRSLFIRSSVYTHFRTSSSLINNSASDVACHERREWSKSFEIKHAPSSIILTKSESNATRSHSRHTRVYTRMRARWSRHVSWIFVRTVKVTRITRRFRNHLERSWDLFPTCSQFSRRTPPLPSPYLRWPTVAIKSQLWPKRYPLLTRFVF